MAATCRSPSSARSESFSRVILRSSRIVRSVLPTLFAVWSCFLDTGSSPLFSYIVQKQKKGQAPNGDGHWLTRRGHSRGDDEARSRRSAPRHARGHQNVPPARFSRFARALFEPRPVPFQKETPSFWMVFLFGAGDEARTRYLDLGKVALYQMSYARKRKIDCSTRIGVCQSRIFSFSIKSQ